MKVAYASVVAALTLSTMESSSFFASAQDLEMIVRGSSLPIPFNQVAYDQSQNNGLTMNLIQNGTAVELDGNMWRALKIPGGLDITEDSILYVDFELGEVCDFQAICLDDNVELSDGPQKCFVLANQQGWVGSMVNTPLMATLDDPNKHFEIPVGQYFTGTVNYVAFIQDNDSSDRTTGYSIFSNLEITDEERNKLKISVNNQTVEVPNKQFDYWISRAKDQDTDDYVLDISESGDSVQVNHNQWKALKFETPLTITERTVMELDFHLGELVDFHMICLDEDTQCGRGSMMRCFTFANAQTGLDTSYEMPTKTTVDNTVHYTIPVGVYFTGTVSYLAFVQDNDIKGDTYKAKGKCTFSNIKIYEDERPDLKITVNGAEMVLSKGQTSYGSSSYQPSDQDTQTNMIEITPDGNAATIYRNTWKAFELATPINITKASEISFNFSLSSEVDFHSCCVDDDLKSSNGKYCTSPAHHQSISGQKTLTETLVGETNHYNVAITGYENTIKYLIFIQDNDDFDESAGEATWSDIVISERPALNIELHGETLSIFNYQVAYDTNQDTSSNYLQVSDDHTSVHMKDGNVWKAFHTETSIDINENTMLGFCVMVYEKCDFIALCLDNDLDKDDGASCFRLAGYQTRDMGNIIYAGMGEANENEEECYLIRLKEYINKPSVHRLAFIQDNDDKTDRTYGSATIENIRIFDAESCLKDIDFQFSMEECTAENFVSLIEQRMENTPGCTNMDPWAELMIFFDVTLRSHIEEKIGNICASAYSSTNLDFNEVTGPDHHFQFTEEYFDGGTTWNYETSSDLSKDAGRVQVINENYASNRAISMPDVHNFKGCHLRTAMCCFVSNRDPTNPTGNEPEDNSDACYMDFTKARQSSHVRDGYSIYGNGVEGNMHCHGFAWGNDPGYADAAFKGNAIWHVSMKKNLYDTGNVEELPGAPMCGCIEQMPVVTNAACTELDVTQMVMISYDSDSSEWVATVVINKIEYKDCVAGNLMDHYGELVREGKATPREEELLAEHLVGDGGCGEAIGSFLETKGLNYLQQ